MPLRIQNYGNSGGDKSRGYHPPACTCYKCNEERRLLEASKEEERRSAEYDRRVAETSQHAKNTAKDPKKRAHPRSCQCVECVKEKWERNSRNPANRRSPQGNSPDRNRPVQQPSGKPQTSSQQLATEVVHQSKAGARPTVHTQPSPPSFRSPRTDESKAFRLSRAITASALRYALALHAAAALGLMAYALVQGGTGSVLPTLDGAAEAYVQGWRAMGAMAGLVVSHV